jgi:predicted HTH transcriptional regulator
LRGPQYVVCSALIDQPRESLSVELKDWFDPRTVKGTAKLARAALALRNQNGGYLVIGLDDTTRQTTAPILDVASSFNQDAIQGIVSRYASQSFEVAIDFPKRGNQQLVEISIPPGVSMPVALFSCDVRSKMTSVAAQRIPEGKRSIQ